MWPSLGNRYLILDARGLSTSRDRFAYRLAQHIVAAGREVPSLPAKCLTLHVLRHSTAMTILHATSSVFFVKRTSGREWPQGEQEVCRGARRPAGSCVGLERSSRGLPLPQ